MDSMASGHKVLLKKSTKRILRTIKKCRRNEMNRTLIKLLSVLPKPNPGIDKSVLAYACTAQLRSRTNDLTKKRDDLPRRNCNVATKDSKDKANDLSCDNVSVRDREGHSVSESDSFSVSKTITPSTNSTTRNNIVNLQTDTNAYNVQMLYIHGHVNVTITTTRSSQSLLPKILTVIQSHNAEIVHASFNKQGVLFLYFIHARILDADRFGEKETLSALEALSEST